MKLSKLIFAALSAPLLLAGCNGDGGSDGGSLRALSQTTVSGPLAQRLERDLVSLEAYDGSQEVSDYDLLIVDSASHTDEELASERLLIDEANSAHVPVLVLNITSDATHGALRNHTGVSTGGSAEAFLLHHALTETGSTEFRTAVFEALEAPVTGLESSDDASTLTEKPVAVTEETNEANLDAYVDRIEALVRGEKAEDASGDALFRDGTNPTFVSLEQFPPNIPHVEGYLESSVNLPIVGKLFPKGFRITQLNTYHEAHAYGVWDTLRNKYRVFLVSNGNVSLPTTNADGSPLYYASEYNFELETEFKYRLFQSGFGPKHVLECAGCLLSDSSPQNQNNVSSYTDSTSTTVGASASNDGVSVGASYTVGHSVTKEIPDWSVSNTSPGNETTASWDYHQTKVEHEKYADLPDLSRLNLAFQHTSVWSIPQNICNPQFSMSFTRAIGNTTDRGFPFHEAGSPGTSSKPVTLALDLSKIPNSPCAGQ